MKFTLHSYLVAGIILAFATFALSEPIEDAYAEESIESRTGDRVQPRVHAALIHAGLHHGIHGHHHHHHLLHHAVHHPILTKKLLLLKFKKVGALAHHHHHHGLHSLLHHHHGHHGLLHHFRSAPNTGDSVVEVIPISDASLSGVNSGYTTSGYTPSGYTPSAYTPTGYTPTTVQLIGDSPNVQAYSVPAEYLQSISESPEESPLDNYDEVSLDEVPEISPLNKHLLSGDGLDQAPVYLYAVPQQVELGRSASPRINKNRRKFKN